MKFSYNKEIISWLYLYIDENQDGSPLPIIFNISTNLSISFELAYNIYIVFGTVIKLKSLIKSDTKVVDFLFKLLTIKGTKGDIVSYLYENIEDFDIRLGRTFLSALDRIDPIYDENYYMQAKIAGINLLEY